MAGGRHPAPRFLDRHRQSRAVEDRAWEATPEEQRGELSRHNMGIVHEVFFGRKDLVVP